jgi:hypothetical protein
MPMSAPTLNFPANQKVKRPSRARTVRSGQAEHAVSELSIFYGSLSLLASALGTTRDTVRSWGMGSAPARPRVELLERAELLLALCNAARRYMAADRQVGEWTLAPSPPLRGHSPAQVLARHGREGLRILLAELATVAPPRSAGPVEMPSLEQLRASLANGLSPEALERIEQIAAAEPIELSDRDLDAQLREATLQDE